MGSWLPIRTRFITGVLTVVLIVSGCRTAPVTGRKQLMFLPESEEIALGVSAYQQVLEEEPPSTNQQYVEMVNRVGHRIARAANRPDYQWEFRLIASPQPNAFALPGGKVAVNEGILPVCANEAGLAVVLSHEIAHALARHGGERMSQGVVVNGVETAVSYVMRNHEETRRDQILQAYGIASKYGFMLPYSRKHELEADHLGLKLMAKAGYDPREAPRFWERFAASHTSAALPEFLSTHPTDQRRVSELNSLLPDALAYYEQTPEKHGLGVAISVGPSTRYVQSIPPAAATQAGVTSLSPPAAEPAPPPYFTR